jgi:hypothetical protein
MPVVSFSEAAKALGFKSRSSLYRLRDEGSLSGYLREPESTGGAQRLELEPLGLPSLREHVNRQIRAQANNAERHRRVARLDLRWELVAGALGEALADCGGLQLCAAEAHAIAMALPQALAEGFGGAGLELLRVALVEAGCWWAGPPAADQATAEHWREVGRWEPSAEPIDNAELWQHVAPILGANLLGLEGCSPVQAVSVWSIATEAVRDVLAGARWDQARWDAAEVAMYLEDLTSNPGAADTLAWLADRLKAGRVPPELQAEVEQALERYRQRDQQEAAADA